MSDHPAPEVPPKDQLSFEMFLGQDTHGYDCLVTLRSLEPDTVQGALESLIDMVGVPFGCLEDTLDEESSLRGQAIFALTWLYQASMLQDAGWDLHALEQVRPLLWPTEL